MDKKNKKCSKCKEIKPIKEYYRNARANDGHNSYCVACVKINAEHRKIKREVTGTEPPARFASDEQYANKVRQEREREQRLKKLNHEKNPIEVPQDVFQLYKDCQFYNHVLDNFSLVPLVAKFISNQLERIEYKIVTWLDTLAENEQNKLKARIQLDE